MKHIKLWILDGGTWVCTVYLEIQKLLGFVKTIEPCKLALPTNTEDGKTNYDGHAPYC